MVRPQVMGIINITPDSFSGDGLMLAPDYVARAVVQAKQMGADGADILDIGGESTRPGATAVPTEEEIKRTAPVIAAIKKEIPNAIIAIDTFKSETAEAAIKAGASIINDVTALSDANMATIAARHKTQIVLMHNRAQAAQYDNKIGGQYIAPEYENVVTEVRDALQKCANAAMTAGIAHDKIILDPGIGFGKSPQQNMALIKHIDTLKALGFPVLMGVSRKSFIGHVLDVTVDERLEGTAACVAACVLNGADILRVHDVKMMARIVKMASALRDAT